MNPTRHWTVAAACATAVACGGGDASMTTMLESGQTSAESDTSTGTTSGTGPETETTTETTTGTTTGTGEVDASGDSDTGFVFDVGADETTGAGVCPAECDAVSPDGGGEGLWLLHLSNARLWRVSVETGDSTVLCELDTNMTFTTLTFTRENELMASAGNVGLYAIDPCTCAVEYRGDYGNLSGIHGIAPDEDDGLFGISNTADALVRIDPSNANVTPVGPLGVDFDKHGATWSDNLQTLYAINQPTNSLYEVDPDTGMAQLLTTLSIQFGPVGIEMHPENDVLYACSGDSLLYSIDPQSGQMTPIGGPVGEGPAGCTNLGAPWQAGGEVCLPPPAG